jgi:tellurite resistance protein
MWRCITAMAHADGLVSAEEISFLEKIFSKILSKGSLTQEAYETLQQDLKTAQDPFEMLKNINDPAYRGQVIYFARLLAYKDGELHPSEEKLLEKLHFAVVDGLDIEKIKEEVRYNVQEETVLHEIEQDALRPDTGLYGLLDKLMLKFGIDLMD